MGRRNLILNDEEIKKLYLLESLTCKEIGIKLGCSDVTIRNKLLSFGVNLRTPGRKKLKYPRFPFTGTSEEKAYIFGFRVGDLNVAKHHVNSKGFVVRCHTTQKPQVDLIKKIFDRYGTVSVSYSAKNSFHVNCYVDDSFSFLWDKTKIPQEFSKDKKLAWAFIAGYVDAEGNFIINQGRGRFKIDSYDYHVLSWADNFLRSINIASKFRCLARAGTMSYQRYYWPKDLWRLNVNKAFSLLSFIQGILPHLRHRTRIRDAKKVLTNINHRKANGTI